jgi:RNA-directed DNA polymerase
MQGVQRFLERTLKLRINQDKSRVAPTGQATFLGFTFRGVRIRWTGKAFREFKRRVKELTGRSWFVSMELDSTARPVSPGLGELLRDLGLLSADPGS